MNEETEDTTGATADMGEGYGYDENDPTGVTITEADGAEETETPEAGAEGAEGAATEEEPVDWEARAKEYEAKWKTVEDVADYADLARHFKVLGDPQQVSALMAQQAEAARQAQIAAEGDKGHQIAQQFVAGLAQHLAAEPDEVAPFAAQLGEFLAPIMAELAETRELRDQLKAQNQTSAVDREVASLKTSFPDMDEVAVRREFLQGRNGRDEAVRTHTTYQHRIKAATQNSAIAALKGKTAPNVAATRGGSAPSGGRQAHSGPDMFTDPQGFDAWWEKQKRGG